MRNSPSCLSARGGVFVRERSFVATTRLWERDYSLCSIRKRSWA